MCMVMGIVGQMGRVIGVGRDGGGFVLEEVWFVVAFPVFVFPLFFVAECD